MEKLEKDTPENLAADAAATPRRAKLPLWRRLHAQVRSDRLSAGIIVFALAVITGMWAVTEAQIVRERSDQLAVAMRERANLARAFEEHTVRTLSHIDGIMLALKDRYEAEGAKFDLSAFYRQMRPNPAVLRNAVITDAAGQVILNTLPGPRMSLADREHIKVHLFGPDNGALFISKPVIARTNKQRSIIATRRVNKADGTLAGVITVVIIPEYFSDFYRDVFRGTGSIVTLVGTDGIVRARLAADSADLGQDISHGPGFKRMMASSFEPSAPTVTYIGRSAVDGIERVHAARHIRGYPLMVFVGTPVAEVLATVTVRARSYRIAASVASVLIGIFAFLLVSFNSRRERAARSLRSASTMLERTGGIARVGGWELDLRTNVLSWSTETYRIHEIDPPVVPTLEQAIAFYAPEARPVIEAAVREGIAQGTPWDLELPLITAKGRHICVRAQGSAVIEDGKAVRLVGAFQDITEHNAAEEQLRQSADRTRRLLSAASVGLWEWNLLTEAVYFSPEWKRQLGYADDEIANRFDEWQKRVHPEDLARALAAVGDFRDGRAPRYSVDVRMLHRDGSWRWIHGEADLERNEQGEPVMMMGSHTDITDRKLAELAQQAAETRFHNLVDSTDGVVWEANAATFNFTYVSSNAERILGYPAQDWLQPGFWAAHIADEDRAQSVGFCQARTALGEDHSFEYRFCARDGRILWMRDIVKVVSEGGRPRLLRGLMIDISMQKQAETKRTSLEAQLRESQKMEAIGTLAGGIAHDFNNIVAAIIGNTDLARQDVVAGNPAALQSLDEILKAGRRARDLVQQILSFSRRQPTERKLIALPLIIDESVRLLRATLPARIILEVQCEAGVPAVLADATQMEQVIVNLATNAMQAMRSAPGQIAIRLDAHPPDANTLAHHAELHKLMRANSGRLVRLSVTDNGPGMDEATRARIFEPFFTTKPPGEGTGLGLSVVLGIVQAHEGALVVASEPGKGATFTMYLPVPAANAVAAADDVQPDQSAAAPRQGSGQHILYVDDDEALVFLVKRLLERRGCRVSAFTDQREALAALLAEPDSFDLLVTDYNMPGMSGLDVAREAKIIRADLPVAVASGFIDETLRANAHGAGVRELIFKASVADDLCAAIMRLADPLGEP